MRRIFCIAVVLPLFVPLLVRAVEDDKPDLEFHKGVPASELKIKIAPAAKMSRKEHVLLKVSLANESKEEIKTTLTHEWHGGIWPSTDLYASVTSEKEKKARPFHPAYLVGEDQNAPRAITLAPGKTLDIFLRMDWPGTGSVPTEPLVGAPGKYAVKLLLVFEVEGKKQYAATSSETLELPAQ